MVGRPIVVDAPIETALAAFTERFGDFRPPEHNLLGVEIAKTVFEPRAGDSIYDRGVNGSKRSWPRVLAYEPPDRVVCRCGLLTCSPPTRRGGPAPVFGHLR